MVHIHFCKHFNLFFFFPCIESVRTLMIPWLQRLCEHASKVEDKTLPLLAQHWARISRTIQSNKLSPDTYMYGMFSYLHLLCSNCQAV